MKKLSITETLYGYPINADICVTDCGIQLLLEGGQSGHIGAVAVVASGTPLKSIVFPSHREDVICKHWVSELYRYFQVPVIVSAGIHYDEISSEEIQEILKVTDRMLSKVIELIKS